MWDSQNFPFLSQSLFNATSTFTNYTIYDQSLILKSDFTIDESKLAVEGIPYLTGTYIAYLITSNAGLTATLVHMLLWNWNDLKGAWSWIHPRHLSKLLEAKTYMFWRESESPEDRLARKLADPNLDPHYKLVLRNKYKEVPLWWWGLILVISFVIGVVCLYSIKVLISVTQYPRGFANMILVHFAWLGIPHCPVLHFPLHTLLWRSVRNHWLWLQHPGT